MLNLQSTLYVRFVYNPQNNPQEFNKKHTTIHTIHTNNPLKNTQLIYNPLTIHTESTRDAIHIQAKDNTQNTQNPHSQSTNYIYELHMQSIYNPHWQYSNRWFLFCSLHSRTATSKKIWRTCWQWLLGGCRRRRQRFTRNRYRVKDNACEYQNLCTVSGISSGVAGGYGARPKTAIVNDNRDLPAGCRSAGRLSHFISNSLEDGKTDASEQLSEQPSCSGGAAGTSAGGTYNGSGAGNGGRSRSTFGSRCPSAARWLRLKSKAGNAAGSQSRHTRGRGLDLLRAWSRSNNYSGVSLGRSAWQWRSLQKSPPKFYVQSFWYLCCALLNIP